MNMPENAAICSISWCNRPELSKKYCATHYKRSQRGLNMDAPIVNKNRNGEWGEWLPNADGYLRRSRTLNGVYEYQLQHRVTMEDLIGRTLLASETVHHVNGVRWDNRIANLELWSSSQPAGQRVTDKIAWAKEVLATYEPEALA